MGRGVRVTSGVTSAIWLIKAAFEHFKNALVIGGGFVAVCIFNAAASDPVHVPDIVGPQAITGFPEDLRGVVAADIRYKARPVKLLHGFYNVPLQGAFRIPQDNGQARLADPLPDIPWDRVGHVQKRLAASYCPGLYAPSVALGLPDIFALLISEYHIMLPICA